jgi:hypothetical protein
MTPAEKKYNEDARKKFPDDEQEFVVTAGRRCMCWPIDKRLDWSIAMDFTMQLCRERFEICCRVARSAALQGYDPIAWDASRIAARLSRFI